MTSLAHAVDRSVELAAEDRAVELEGLLGVSGEIQVGADTRHGPVSFRLQGRRS
jgi:hypothetical protein